MGALQIRPRAPPPWLEPAVPLPGDDRIRTHRLYEPGDAWYATRAPDGWLRFPDGPPEPLRIASMHAHARPILVVLPGAGLHCLHQPYSRGDQGWSITGDLERRAQLRRSDTYRYTRGAGLCL